MVASVDTGQGHAGAAATDAVLVDRGALDRAWDAETSTIAPFREALRSASEQLAERFRRR